MGAPDLAAMSDEEDSNSFEEYNRRRRRRRNQFDKRVETWIHPAHGLDVNLANDLANKMGRETYATYADVLNIQVKERAPDPAYMNPQAIQQRAAAGRMLLLTAVSAQYGSKWEGEVTVPVKADAADFLKCCEETSGLVLKGYTISYNGRLLQSLNSLYDVGLRDGYKVVLLPMKKGINARPHWSVRQTEAVTFKMEDRHKKLRVTDQTQSEIKELLGKVCALCRVELMLQCRTSSRRTRYLDSRCTIPRIAWTLKRIEPRHSQQPRPSISSLASMYINSCGAKRLSQNTSGERCNRCVTGPPNKPR